ncbi:MAG: sulfotransferase family 2 domain-containing protein [Verrucomicrobiae bacterium]|nr:sulfotransferase family 2 domain-containing protein [Verrucomicrobiae bacterium]
MLAFIHIHKCGGSSLQELIRKNFRGRCQKEIELSPIRGLRKPDDLSVSIQQRGQSDGYIMGHFAYGVHQLFQEECEYATMLRKPKGRLVSLYRHAKVEPNAYYHHQAKVSTFENFLTNGSVLEADNGMVRFLSGDAKESNMFINPKPFGTLDQSDLDRAIKNLESHIVAFGLLERFDESLLVFSQCIGLKKCCYTRINKTPSEVEIPDFDSSFTNLIALDEILYHRAEEVFNERLRQYGLSDGKAVDEFRRKNARIQPWLKAVARSKYVAKGIGRRIIQK